MEERERPPKYNSGLAAAATAARDPVSYKLTLLALQKPPLLLHRLRLFNSISKFPKPLTWSPLKEPFA